jgi:uncharacterized YigZ family protein
VTKLSTIETSEEISWIEKHSRFIAVAKACKDIASFDNYLSQLKAAYPDANHIVYAYTILEDDNMRIKCFDDGEPSGTAGKPILSHIDGKRLVNTAIFVVRYFGGVKLGAGGLVRAYSHSARLAIEAAKIIPFTQTISVALSLDYNEQKDLTYNLKRFNAKILATSYEHQVNYTITIEQSHYEEFKKLFPECKKL